MKTSVKVAIALLSSAVFLTPTVVLANRFTDQVRLQLIQAAVALGLANNYTLTHNPYVDSLEDNGSDSLTLNLQAGTSYAIVGVCDEDCGDIDLRLYDAKGNFIDSDTHSDDNPVVTVTPRWTSNFKVQVKMASCSHSPCYYGVGAFGQ